MLAANDSVTVAVDKIDDNPSDIVLFVSLSTP